MIVGTRTEEDTETGETRTGEILANGRGSCWYRLVKPVPMHLRHRVIYPVF